MHRPDLLSGQGGRARCENHRHEPELVQISTVYGVQQEGSPSCRATSTPRFGMTARSRRTTPSGLNSKSASSPPRPSSPREAMSAPSTRYARTRIARCIIPSKPATAIMRSGRPNRKSSVANKPLPTQPGLVSSQPLPPPFQCACSSVTSSSFWRSLG